MAIACRGGQGRFLLGYSFSWLLDTMIKGRVNRAAKSMMFPIIFPRANSLER